MKPLKDWSRRFDDPVPGFETLRDAAEYIQKLPKAEQMFPHWQDAANALIMAAEGRGPLLLARVGMLKALGHGKDETKLVRKKRAKAYKIIR